VLSEHIGTPIDLRDCGLLYTKGMSQGGGDRGGADGANAVGAAVSGAPE
jgi:hypothetical protein